jgi:hypothetical protein
MKRINKVWVASLDGEIIVAGTNKMLTRRRGRDIINSNLYGRVPVVLTDIDIDEAPLMIGGHVYGVKDAG